jgi:hypothetical protein
VLKNKYEFNNLMSKNIFACPIKSHINDDYNRHYGSYNEPLVQQVLIKLHLENRINELRLCWANSFALHYSKLPIFLNMTINIITKNKHDACDGERFLAGILYTLNNYKNDTIEDIYTEEEIGPLWSIDIPSFNETKYCFTKKITNKH